MEGLVNIPRVGNCISSPDLFRYLEEEYQDVVDSVNLTASKLYSYMNNRGYEKYFPEGNKTYFKISDFIEMFSKKGQSNYSYEEIASELYNFIITPSLKERENLVVEENENEFDFVQSLKNLSNINVLDKNMISGVEINGVYYIAFHRADGVINKAIEIDSSNLNLLPESNTAKEIVSMMVYQLALNL